MARRAWVAVELDDEVEVDEDAVAGAWNRRMLP